MYSPTKERIEELKIQHGEIFMISVEDKAAIFKAPNRKTLSYANNAKQDIVKFNETILNACYVEGDRELLDNDKYFLAAGAKAIELIEIKEAEIVKL